MSIPAGRSWERLMNVLWSGTSGGCSRGTGEGIWWLKSHLLPQLLCDPAAVNVLYWVSPVTCISQGCTDRERRKRMVWKMFNFSPDSAFPGWFSPLAHPSYHGRYPLPPGLAALHGFLGFCFPKGQPAFEESPPATAQAHRQGRLGAPPPLIELGPIQTQIKGSIHSHAPGCKMITPRSQSRIFPQSWGIPWEFPAVWDICC